MTIFFRTAWIDPQTIELHGYGFFLKLESVASTTQAFYESISGVPLAERVTPFVESSEPIHGQGTQIVVHAVQMSDGCPLSIALLSMDTDSGFYVVGTDSDYWFDAAHSLKLATHRVAYKAVKPAADISNVSMLADWQELAPDLVDPIATPDHPDEASPTEERTSGQNIVSLKPRTPKRG